MELKEQRIRKITQLYYSRSDVQKAIFDFSQNREIAPRYFEGFGKRPDSFQYIGDIFELVKKGATSFHCSEELWHDPLKLSTELPKNHFNELRKGWDFILDIDSKYVDYSKIYTKIIIDFLKFSGIKNIGVKFSGSKGMHIIIPWNSFPKEVNGLKTSDMFPEWPRIISNYIAEKTKPLLIKKISEIMNPNSKYIRDFSIPEQVMPDLILVSSRHLFRMPYSLHEKTALASVVLSLEEIKDFQLKDADPLKIKIKNFLPEVKEGEASQLLIEALDWHKENYIEKDKKELQEFKPIKLENLSEKYFPPSIQKILAGIEDGKKRALFILINFFRCIGLEKEEIEKKLYDWNKKNPAQLREGYIQTQLLWLYKKPPVLPPNFAKDYYKGIGIIPSDEELKYKNPVNYVLKKSFANQKNMDKFKNKR